MARDGFDLEYEIGKNETETAKNLANALKAIGVTPNMAQCRKQAREVHRKQQK